MHRLVLLAGTEDTLRRQALAELKEQIGGDPFDFQVFVAGEAPPAEWLAAVATVPFLSECRTVIVRNLLRIGPPADAFSDPGQALRSVPETGRLILVADDETTSDSARAQRLGTIRKAWESEVVKAGGMAATFQMDPAAAKRTILGRADDLGRKLSPAAAGLLIEMTGGSLSRALEELEKAVLYAGEAETIRESDIEATALASREWSVFKMADRILEGNLGQALAQLRVLAGSGAKAENAAMQSIFPSLSRNLRLVWQARIFVEARANPANPPASVAALLPEQGNFAKATDFQRNRAMAAARKLSFERLAACMEVLARTDARLKGLEAGFTPLDTLERMVQEMVRAVRGEQVQPV